MEIRLGETNRLSKMMAHLARRWRQPRTDRLPDYLLRDAGLERVGGVTRRRLR
jgi:hypothetical protein